jgi:phosphoribosylformimino-5-aminoimidazole carboxamide ribotide isomerase
VRTLENLETAFSLGVYRAVLGTAAVEDPELVISAVRTYGECIAVGIDAKEGFVKTAGWIRDSGLNYLEFASRMESYGVKTIIFTDIDTDGMQAGPGIERLKRLRETVRCEIVASGGVSSLDDIKKLKQAGMDAAIIGKAIYSGAIDLKAAIGEAGAQCLQKE